MGTNFYWTDADNRNECPTCRARSGDAPQRMHIGKSSAGWCFALHVYPHASPASLDEWRELFARPGSQIEDEYGSVLTANEMVARIVGRSWPRAARDFDYEQNHAVPAPGNLVRHRVDGRHCVGHGEGTWDLIVGEFS